MLFDAIGIVCNNIHESIRFYKLFDLSFERIGNGDHFEATTTNGTRIMLDSQELIKQIDPNWKEDQGSRIILCFKQDKPELVNQIFKKIKDNGFLTNKEPWDAFWNQRYASVFDPDGNQIDLFADL